MLPKSDTSGARSGAWLRMLVPVAIAMELLAAPRKPDTEVQLEAAIHREVVVGDLRGAMEQYRAILAQTSPPRAVAARALLQLGHCQEKLGQKREAFNTYRRLVSDYNDQAEVAGLGRSRLADWAESLPAPRNLKFEEGVVGKVPPGWFVLALPKDADYLAELRRTECRSGIGCAVLMVPANAPRPLSYLMQSFGAAAFRGKTVRLRAWLRLEAVGQDDRAQMWLSVDRERHRSGFFDNMDDRPVRSGAWTECEIVGRINDDAAFIDIGVMSIGRGRVWVDDVSFEVVTP